MSIRKVSRLSARRWACWSAIAGGLFAATPAGATLVQTTVSSGVQTTYDPNILANDLINNGSAALSGAPVTTGNIASYAGDVPPGNSWSNLTDGAASSKVNNNDISHDTYFDGTAMGTSPSITYTFNTAASPQGYTLTSINSINGWADTTDFSNQRYTVSIALVGSPTTFTQLASVAYSPFSGDAGVPNSSQVTLTDTTGTLATNVAAIRFAIGNNGGVGQVFREIDVVGTATPAPEPSSLALLGLGAVGLLRRRRA